MLEIRLKDPIKGMFFAFVYSELYVSGMCISLSQLQSCNPPSLPKIKISEIN